MAVVHRASSAPPAFTVANDTAWCNITIASSNIHLSFRKMPSGAPAAAVEPFTAHGLAVSDGTHVWHAGDNPTGNLGGTVSTLSGVDGAIPLNCTGPSAPGRAAGGGKGATDMHCTLGVVSRDGWAVVNDTFDAGQWIDNTGLRITRVGLAVVGGGRVRGNPPITGAWHPHPSTPAHPPHPPHPQANLELTHSLIRCMLTSALNTGCTTVPPYWSTGPLVHCSTVHHWSTVHPPHQLLAAMTGSP